MGYFDKKNKFNALKQDLENINNKSSKNAEANLAFGGGEIGDPTKKEPTIIEKEVEKIPTINLDLIENRDQNDFASIKVNTLKASILSTRLLDPISVRENGDGKYTIISGHRRKKAYDEIVQDLKMDLLKASKGSEEAKRIQEKIDQYSSIPAIIYEVVPDSSKMLGTNTRYITTQQEEEMYRAGNLESRQLSQEELIKHIVYFYELIKNDKKLYNDLLEERNLTAKRKATKLNIPETLKELLIGELKFKANPTHIWRVVSILDDDNVLHAKIKEVVLNKIKNENAPVKPAFETYQMYTKICDDDSNDKKELKGRILKQIEMGKDAEPLYNQYFNLQEEPTKKIEKKELINKKDVLLLLQEVKTGLIGLDTAINKIQKL